MGDLEVLDWCMSNFETEPFPRSIDVDHAVITENLDAIKFFTGSCAYSHYKVAQKAANSGIVSIFRYSFKKYLEDENVPVIQSDVGNIMYNIVRNGHKNLLEWLENQEDIYERLYFPMGIYAYENDTTERQFSMKNNPNIAKTACIVRNSNFR